MFHHGVTLITDGSEVRHREKFQGGKVAKCKFKVAMFQRFQGAEVSRFTSAALRTEFWFSFCPLCDLSVLCGEAFSECWQL